MNRVHHMRATANAILQANLHSTYAAQYVKHTTLNSYKYNHITLNGYKYSQQQTWAMCPTVLRMTAAKGHTVSTEPPSWCTVHP